MFFMMVFLAALIIQGTYAYAKDNEQTEYDSLIDEADLSLIHI